jgi:hypothetical protein
LGVAVALPVVALAQTGRLRRVGMTAYACAKLHVMFLGGRGMELLFAKQPHAK